MGDAVERVCCRRKYVFAGGPCPWMFFTEPVICRRRKNLQGLDVVRKARLGHLIEVGYPLYFTVQVSFCTQQDVAKKQLVGACAPRSTDQAHGAKTVAHLPCCLIRMVEVL